MAVIAVVFNIPTTTKQSINFAVTAKRIPFYVKLCGFLYRDYQYKELSRSITEGAEGDMDKIMAVYAWTIKNIKRQPEDFAIVDDHIWYIIVRGYGLAEQMADVFTILASYAGYDAFRFANGVSRNLVLSFVKIDDTWYMFDIYNKKFFASEEDLKIPTPHGLTYGEHLKKIDKKYFNKHITRADKQKILPRIIYELKKLFTGTEQPQLRS